MANRALSSKADTTTHATIGASTLADNITPPVIRSHRSNDSVYDPHNDSSDDFTANFFEAMKGNGKKKYGRGYVETPPRPKSRTQKLQRPSSIVSYERVRPPQNQFTSNPHYPDGTSPASVVSYERARPPQKPFIGVPQCPDEVSPPSSSSIIGDFLKDSRPFQTPPGGPPTLSAPQKTILGDRELITHLQAEFQEAKRQIRIKDEKISVMESEILSKDKRLSALESELLSKDKKKKALEAKNSSQAATLADREAEIKRLRHTIRVKDSAAKALDQEIANQMNRLIAERDQMGKALMLAWAEKECPGEIDSLGRQKYRYKYLKKNRNGEIVEVPDT